MRLCLFNTSLKLMPVFQCCLSLSTEIFDLENDTLFSPGILDNATQLTWAREAFKHGECNLFFKGLQGEKKCSLENNIHGKTTFTSFLLRSSQIIGSDEESIENSEFSWEKNLNNAQRSLQNTRIQEITPIKVPGNHFGT